jgi:hypothetical protein
LPCALLHADLQRVVTLDAAGIIEAYRRGVACAATVDQSLGERPRRNSSIRIKHLLVEDKNIGHVIDLVAHIPD